MNDTARRAALLAEALRAEKLILLTNKANCTNYKYKISLDETTAYNQGVAEADAASDAAQALLLFGQVLYYDLEAFDTTHSKCHKSAKSFINGWTYQLHLRGFLSGVYGSPCRSGLPDFWGLANMPDAVWIAHWIYPGYNPNAKVWDVACMGNTYWPNGQRLRQYAGGHAETWGGVQMTVDSNAMEGVVAQAFGYPPGVCPKTGAGILYADINYGCGGQPGRRPAAAARRAAASARYR